MYQIDFNKPEHVHFIGIGGISMSGLAEILMDEGFTVSGSDAHKSELTEHLEAKGAKIFYGQKAENIIDGIHVVVYTAAVHPDNPEFAAAVKKGLPILTRAELLGQMMKNYQYAVGISGTHGKTTTTSMVTEILLAADADPTISVGGILNSIGGNIRVGGSELFVTEACEYTNSFLSFFPNREVILNIEADHLDFFKDIEDIRHSFRLFAQKLPKDGLLVINSDIDRYEEIVDGLECRIVTCGKRTDSNYRAEDITYDHFARAAFRLMIDGQDAGEITLGVPGEHNVYNALAAIALCRDLGIDMEHIRAGLKKFTGTNRRFEKKGEIGGVTVIDDYAHHPTEIKATLKAAKELEKHRVICVFQPHRYSRTSLLKDEFATAFTSADEIYMTDIYSSGEDPISGIDGHTIPNIISEVTHQHVNYVEDVNDLPAVLAKVVRPNDLVITMGAGSINQYGPKLLALLEEGLQ